MHRTSLYLPLAAMILVIGTIMGLMMADVAPAVLITALSALIAATVALQGEPEPRAVEPVSPAPEPSGLFELSAFHTLIDRDSRAMLGLSGMTIALANDAALALLGRHIAGIDVRTALRHPAVVDALAAQTGEPVQLLDFRQPGDRWQLSIAPLGGAQRLLMLEDRSAFDAADRMRSDFVANASHELRTPLAAIIGYAETLSQMDAEEAEPVRGRFLGIIEREARRMQQLVADLISISRIEADRYRRPTDKVDLAVQVRSAVAELNAAAAPRSADIQLNLPSAAPIQGDGAQLVQLAHNIIGNALKYGRAGTPVAVSILADVGGWQLSVRDEGDGIAPEHLPRLTERFYRVDDARGRAVGGTGLGLAIVKHIAERHRGRLSIDSVVGEGTTVSVWFPALTN
jgi:two-component system, OmpR family, phosphate regulon sensor histidine kinase PhoR